jgi:hypothetical protein
LVNPANKDQRYIVWSNGWIQPIGGALPVAQAEARFGESPVAPNAPTFYEGGGHPVCSAKVISWSTPSGYTMNIWGSVFNWGGTTVPSDGGPPNVWLYQPVFGYYNDFVMNPAGNGQGYALNYDGDVIAFSTGTPGITHSAFLTGTGVQALRLYMDWTSKRYWVLDSLGRWWGMNGGNNLAVGALPPLGILPGDQTGMQFAGDLYDYTAAAKGWHLNQFGQVNALGGAADAPGHPGPLGYKIYQDIKIISQASPIRLALLNEFGGIFEYIVSTAPTVTVQLPNATQTTTTRPTVGWTVFDPEGDAVVSWDLSVANSTQYGGGGFDPWVSTVVYRITGQTSGNTRSLQLPVDLPNATYRAYVRVRDASGLQSTTANITWIQNVTRPTTPTVTPTVTGSPIQRVSLLINRGTLIANERVGVQYQDADDTTWRWVQNGWDLVPDGSGNATVIDYGAGFGVQRTYRAVHYVYDSATGAWNGSDFSTTANATLTDKSKWVLATADSSDQMTIRVQPGLRFTQETRAGTFWPSGREDPIVIRDGVPKFMSTSLSLWVLDNATRVALEAILRSQVLLLRDPFGHRYYVVPVQNIEQTPMHASPLLTETTPLRDANVFSFEIQRVARPKTGPLVGPLAA